jgi:hypothetical protein
MAQDGQASTAAPELALDAQSQTGFVKWFNTLEQVRRTRPNALRLARARRQAPTPRFDRAAWCGVRAAPTRPPRPVPPLPLPPAGPQAHSLFRPQGGRGEEGARPRRAPPGRALRAGQQPRAPDRPARPRRAAPCLRTPQGFYSAHGENALFVARTFYRTTAVVKYLGGGAGSGGWGVGGAGGARVGEGRV